MDKIELDSERLAAGERYNDAIHSLGLKPHGLLWGYDLSATMFLLVLITPLIDLVGPLALSEKLFSAYRSAATPSEIDPFIVRIHSPRQSFPKQLQAQLSTRIMVSDLDEKTGLWGPEYRAHEKADVIFGVEGLEIMPNWIYFLKHPQRDTLDLSLQWKRFSKNVDRLAA